MHVQKINIKPLVCNYYFDDLVTKNLGTKNILIYQKNDKNLKIYFTRSASQQICLVCIIMN